MFYGSQCDFFIVGGAQLLHIYFPPSQKDETLKVGGEPDNHHLLPDNKFIV